MHVEWVVHRVVGVHLVDQADLDPIADPESPGDGVVLLSARSVHQLPAGVGRGREAVDVDHVVFQLDPIGLMLMVAGPVRVMMMLIGRSALMRPPPLATRPAGTSFIPHFGQRSGCSLVTSGCIGQA